MKRNLIVTRFHFFMLVVALVIMGTAFVKIPESHGLPVHWGFDGKPDRVWSRDAVLPIFPIVGMVLTAIFWAIGQWAPAARIEPGKAMSQMLLTGLLGLLCALEFALILIGIGSDIDLIRIINFGVAAVLLLVGIGVAPAEPNAYSGLRLPWQLDRSDAWIAAHRLTGGLLALGGIGLAVAGWLGVDSPTLVASMAAAIFLPLVLGGIFSLIRARR